MSGIRFWLAIFSLKLGGQEHSLPDGSIWLSRVPPFVGNEGTQSGQIFGLYVLLACFVFFFLHCLFTCFSAFAASLAGSLS
jgi:hypothetical protein